MPAGNKTHVFKGKPTIEEVSITSGFTSYKPEYQI